MIQVFIVRIKYILWQYKTIINVHYFTRFIYIAHVLYSHTKTAVKLNTTQCTEDLSKSWPYLYIIEHRPKSVLLLTTLQPLQCVSICPVFSFIFTCLVMQHLSHSIYHKLTIIKVQIDNHSCIKTLTCKTLST